MSAQLEARDEVTWVKGQGGLPLIEG